MQASIRARPLYLPKPGRSVENKGFFSIESMAIVDPTKIFLVIFYENLPNLTQKSEYTRMF